MSLLGAIMLSNARSRLTKAAFEVAIACVKRSLFISAADRMTMPTSIEARLFYRCAWKRLEEAQVLLRAEYGTGAVYLAGYGVECILKALILQGAPQDVQQERLESFRGSRAHDYNWLRTVYLKDGGARFPQEITQGFTLVNGWSTDMRYDPGSLRRREAEAFLRAAQSIIHWADGRL